MLSKSIPIRRLGLQGFLLTPAVFLALITSAEGVHAQCWDCATVLYEDPPCWMDSCTWTDGAGYSDCGQSGGCGDIDTCHPYGNGCEGDPGGPPGGSPVVLLDGRSSAGMSATQVYALLADATPEVLARIVWSREADAEYLKLSCNGAVIHAMYSSREAARLRFRTSRITL